MSTRATGKFEVKNWDENPYDEREGASKTTRASVKQEFKGDIEGEGSVEYLMAYREDGTADFVGLQRIVGKVGGKSGSFVLQLQGKYDGKAAKADWTVVPGSGTDELEDLRGQGGFQAEHGPDGSLTLDYDLG